MSMITISVFAASVVVLTILFLSKHREVKTGERTFLGKFLSKFDVQTGNVLEKTRYRFYQIVQTIRYLFLVHIPEKSKVKISKTKESVASRYSKQKDAIMGKKELNSNGSSSFFLRKVTEHKNAGSGGENGERGRIEDESINALKEEKME